MVTVLITEIDLKSLREYLCVAQHAVNNDPIPNSYQARTSRALGLLIQDIDRQRPLGTNGKHGTNHTPTCQCEDL